MINDTARSQPGWTLMNVQKGQGDTRARSDFPPYAVMYDSGGLPVWYYVDGTNPDIGGAVSAELTDKGVLIGATWNASLTTGTMPIEVDFAGNTLWQCSTAVCGGSQNINHHASKLSNGNYMLLEAVTTSGVQNAVYREVSPANQVVSSLEYAKFVTPPSGATGDWCHGNAITVDIANNAIYANCRYAGLLKTTYTNPTKQWHPARHVHQHQDRRHRPSARPARRTATRTIRTFTTDGTIAFYDNGGYSGGVGGTTSQFRSRVVEYQINETAKTATLDVGVPGRRHGARHLVHRQLVQPVLGRRASPAQRQLPGRGRDPGAPRREPGLRGRQERQEGGVGVPLPDRLRRLPRPPDHAAARSRAHAVA